LNTTKKAESGFSPTYLIRLENVDDRDEALQLRGYVLYALVDEKVNNLLKEDEYIVSDLIGLNVFLDESTDDHSGKGFEELFVGHIRGVVLGSEMCSIPGLGQDLLEVALPSRSRDCGKREDLVLIPFVPEIVTRVNLEGRLISIIPPGGLLDLSYRREEKVRIKGLLPQARDS
jgi:ribosomal 30S subunit maturation factor RimM